MLENIKNECDFIMKSFDVDNDKERVLNQLYGFLHGVNSLGLLEEWYELYKEYEKNIIEN